MARSTVSGILILTILLTNLVFIGCVNRSRYRLDLYMQDSRGKKLAEVENTKFVVKSRFVPRTDDIEMLQGDNNTLIATISTTWKKESERKIEEVLAFDEVSRFRVFFNIAEPVKAGLIFLKGNSAAQLSGNYDIAPEKKVYTPTTGSMVIDSVKDSHFFATIEGQYRNVDGKSLQLKGQFKVKYR